MTVSAFAPGKLILMGEHAVVYGHPALAIAVDRGTTVHLEQRAGPTDLDMPWADDPRLRDALLAILPSAGVGVQIESTLPVGRGMGSSAALAVALARAAARLDGREASDDEINEGAFRVERIFHGNPSGIDHTVSMNGGALTYRRTPDGPRYEQVDLAPLPLVVIDSGSSGNTADLVAGVRSRRPDVDEHLAAMGALLDDTLPALVSGDLEKIGRSWCENHRLLQAIGVSSPTLDHIVHMATASGALGAKLAGAGGGGVVIALTSDPQKLSLAASREGFDSFQVKLHKAVLQQP